MMEDRDLPDVEQGVTQSIAADPRATYLLLISVAQAWGGCLHDLSFGLDTLDENHTALDDTFDFVPEPIRAAVKTYTLIGYQIAAGTLPGIDD
jgi:hypothetical protein